MDGNGRWAKQRDLPRHAGHKAGVKSVRASVEQSVKRGIEVLTLFAFSSENWKRPEKEVSLLMDLFMVALQREVKRLKRNNVRLRIIGDRSAFSEKLQQRIAAAEASTADNSGLVLQIAANYGGRWDIVQAVRKLARSVEAGELAADQITESAVASGLSFADLPDPDLFIRTGGEQRISNFMLWQSAYTELYFTDRYWPDFDADAFDAALDFFASRQRRFGMTGEQLPDTATQDLGD
ncbi:polyprenyl diphosphate synthase [Sedimenticola thiotaurini]